MKIQLTNLGKRYNTEWIFRNLNYEFTPDNAYAILGANGSGKSTLLQVLAGNFQSSEGAINYSFNNAKITQENIFRHIAIAAPYLELPEELTFLELINFQKKFKPLTVSHEELIELSGLGNAKNKLLKYYSSGMKQRAKLSLAILANAPLLLLDEPATNLDKQGVEWYRQVISEHAKNKLIIVASNHQQEEYYFCTAELEMENFKVKQIPV